MQVSNERCSTVQGTPIDDAIAECGDAYCISKCVDFISTKLVLYWHDCLLHSSDSGETSLSKIRPILSQGRLGNLPKIGREAMLPSNCLLAQARTASTVRWFWRRMLACHPSRTPRFPNAS